MHDLETIALPVLQELPPAMRVGIYSPLRKFFLDNWLLRHPKSVCTPPEELQRVLWGIKFKSPLMNAAGMFKNGDGYTLAVAEGAGAYLAGTTTGAPREGNQKSGVALPFVPYRRSHAASNWLGLPNRSHAVVARRLNGYAHEIPIGASVMLFDDGVDSVLEGLWLYADAGVDFIELNASCPNVFHALCLEDMLDEIKVGFLDGRTRTIPVIVKYATDTSVDEVRSIVRFLIERGFDGVNFGNTSINYVLHRSAIQEDERDLFDYFTRTFGGGVSGRPLKEQSLLLAKTAVAEARTFGHMQEFHVIRTGGIESALDIQESDAAGISMNQWYSGYFEGVGRYGHAVYRQMYDSILERRKKS